MRSRSSISHNMLLLVVVVLSVAGIAKRAYAQDFALMDLRGNRASLDTFLNDGKFTLFMIRSLDCSACDKAESELQQWYARQEENKVSVLALNVDEVDKKSRVIQRLTDQGVNYPNFFTRDNDKVARGFYRLTGKNILSMPRWLLFGPDGSYVGTESGPGFDWVSMDEMVQSAGSGLPSVVAATELDATKQPERVVRTASPEDIHSNGMVSHITSALVREDMVRAERWLQEALERNPDHPGLLAAQVRYLMLTEREPANSPLGYRYTKKASGMMQNALDSALAANPAHGQALYLQSELYTTQGDLRAAGKALQVAREHGIDSWSLKYIISRLQIMQEQPSEAIKTLDPILYETSKGRDRSFIFQQAWDQVKIVAMKYPEHDPLAIVREGLMVRVPRKNLMEEIVQRSKSKTPLVVIISSEDPRCGYCVNKGEEVGPFIRANKDRYNFIYTSIEPWQNISYQEWSYQIPRVSGVPAAAVFARSQYMTTEGLPIGADMTSRFSTLYPLLSSESPGVIDYEAKLPRARIGIAYAQWWAKKGEIGAFASVTTDDNQAWGAVANAKNSSQEKADQDAMELCTTHAATKGIKKPCVLSVPAQEE